MRSEVTERLGSSIQRRERGIKMSDRAPFLSRKAAGAAAAAAAEGAVRERTRRDRTVTGGAGVGAAAWALVSTPDYGRSRSITDPKPA
jgi:hypothetical protein